jgi:predicted O-methyltransferase YrrM
MSKLADFYKSKNINLFEGNTQQVVGQTDFLRSIVNNELINNVMEIGFNAGHSAEIFLSSNKNIKLVSFDIGSHEYVTLGKEFIDRTYSGRHRLIIGNSLETVPNYYKQEGNKFDLIFIDGGHEYDVAKGDILNCKKLAHDKTIVVFDDTVNNNGWVQHWNVGPNRAWNEAKEWGVIKELGTLDFSPGRGQSWGIYNL